LKPPKASFVIPVYNGAAYLAETIESCLKQTTENIQIVVVDDCSTDSTDTVIKHYQDKDERILPLKLPENSGRSAARNVGIENASGEIILTLDSDDIALPHRAAHTIQFFKKNPEVDIAFSKFQVLEWAPRQDGILDWVVAGLMDAPPFDWERLKETKLAYIGHSTMAFRKRVFEKVRYSDGPYSHHGIDDWKFQVDAYRAGLRFGAIPKILGQYRFIRKQRDEMAILKLKEACLA